MSTKKSVWTIEDNPQHITEGEVWRVKVGGTGLKACRVLALTSKTVQLMEMPFSHLKPFIELSRVTWLEKVEDEQPEEM